MHLSLGMALGATTDGQNLMQRLTDSGLHVPRSTVLCAGAAICSGRIGKTTSRLCHEVTHKEYGPNTRWSCVVLSTRTIQACVGWFPRALGVGSSLRSVMSWTALSAVVSSLLLPACLWSIFLHQQCVSVCWWWSMIYGRASSSAHARSWGLARWSHDPFLEVEQPATGRCLSIFATLQSGDILHFLSVCPLRIGSACLSVSAVLAHQHRVFALLPMLSHRHWLRSSAKESSTVSVEQANEIVAKLRELETEQNLMKDLFNRASRTVQSTSDVQLNFRQAERHMPGMFNGKATEYTESSRWWPT